MFVSEETKGDDLKLLSDKKKLKQEGVVQASLYRQASWFWRQFLTPRPLIPKQMAWLEN